MVLSKKLLLLLYVIEEKHKNIIIANPISIQGLLYYMWKIYDGVASFSSP
jgi:hypothetical protein